MRRERRKNDLIEFAARVGEVVGEAMTEAKKQDGGPVRLGRAGRQDVLRFAAARGMGTPQAARLLERALSDVALELYRATGLHRPFNSAHEGYAVILEELDELWEHVKRRREDGDPAAMRREAVQAAAMCVRFVVDVCGEKAAPEPATYDRVPCSTCSEEPLCG